MDNRNVTHKVTVITGYYNRADSLRLTIESILQQDYDDFELIVFNDCSTDNTKELLDKLVSEYNDPRLKIRHHSQNKGFTLGMIEAIQSSQSEYVCVQGSGDVSLPGRIRKQAEVLDNNPAVGVVGCYYENYIETLGVSRFRDKVADDMTFEDLLEENVFSHGEVMFRRSSYEEVGGYRKEFVNCQDYDLWLRMIKVCEFRSVKELLYRRYVRYDGVSYNPKSFLRQVRYACLCRDLASMEKDEERNLLGKISPASLESLVPLSEFRVQKQVYSAVLRSMAFDGRSEAVILIRHGVSSSVVSTILEMAVNVYSHRYAGPLRRLMSPLLGLRG